jgi:hypothetical protein
VSKMKLLYNPIVPLEQNSRLYIPFLLFGTFMLGGTFIFSFFSHSSLFLLYLQLLLMLILYISPLVMISGIQKLFILIILANFIPFEFSFGGVEGWQVKDFLILPFFLLFLIDYSMKEKNLKRTPKMSMPVLLFFIIALAHILTLDELPKIIESLSKLSIPSGGFRSYYNIILCGIIYYITPFIFRKEQRIELFVKLLAFVCVFMILFSFARIILGIDYLFYNEAYSSRVHYLSIENNLIPRIGILGVSGYLLFVITLVFVSNSSKKLFMVFIVLSLAATVTSGGRVVFLSLFFSFSFYSYLRKKRVVALVLPIFVLLSLFIIGQNREFIKKFPPILYRYLTVLSPDNVSLRRSDNTRAEMWASASKIIAGNPFWGGRVPTSAGDYNPEAISNVARGAAHNAYLSTAASFGLPALAAWLLGSMLYLRKILRLYYRTAAVPRLNRLALFLAILMGVLFITYFLEGGAGGGINYFLYLGLIDSVWSIYKKNERGKLGFINKKEK